VKTGD